MELLKIKFSNIIVIVSFVSVGVFTVVDMVLASNGIILSDVLIEWVFKFFGLEMLALSGIKISKHIGSAFGKIEEAVDGVSVDDEETTDEGEISG